jgi:hypothetical protein
MSQQPQQTGSRKEGWITLFGLVTSVAANLVAILNGFSGSSNTFILGGAVLAVVLGVVVLIRECGKPFTIKVAAAFGSAVAGFMLGMFFLFGPSSSSLPGTVSSQSSSSEVPSSPSHLLPSVTARVPTPAPSGQVAPALVFDGEVRLGGDTGVDVENGQKNGEMNGVRAPGVSGPLDLYVDRLGLFQASGGGSYAYYGLEKMRILVVWNWRTREACHVDHPFMSRINSSVSSRRIITWHGHA